MRIDDSIVRSYLDGSGLETHRDCWIYSEHGRGNLFSQPDPVDHTWVERLHCKLKKEITQFTPRNAELVKGLFPDFDEVTSNFTLMLVVGFPAPYEAMMMEHDGKQYMVFDLVQFGERFLDEKYSCYGLMTHELVHMCLHNKYPDHEDFSYVDRLNYIAFDEGFAHALSFAEGIESLQIDDSLQEKYALSKAKMKLALAETDPEKQKRSLVLADTGPYWDKFAAICGKLYLLSRPDRLQEIYQAGWHGFAEKTSL